MSHKIRIASINMIDAGSTGTVMIYVAQLATAQGMTARTFSTPICGKQSRTHRVIENHTYFGWRWENFFHTALAKLSGYNGCFSFFGTAQLIRHLKAFRPDIVHLHNLHQFCVHVPSLFRYIKKNKLRVVWTLHDCWSFTGHCPHFTVEGCERWKEGCHSCPRYHKYPKTYVDRSRTMYRLKKRWFSGVDGLTLVTPSAWLADLTRQSYLANYPVHVIHNGIDLAVFRPIESDFRQRYALEKKKILLGVSSSWDESKGLDVFVKLAERLDNSHQIVLVGTDDRIDATLPANILSIHRTENREELAALYTAADLFVNPTREDTYPTVNLEAIACGTPVLTFETGGSPETIPAGCGLVVPCGDVDAMEAAIHQMCADRWDTPLLRRASEAMDMRQCFGAYLDLYRELSHDGRV